MHQTSKRKLKPCPYLLDKTTDLNELIDLYLQKAEGVIAKSYTCGIPYRIRDFVAVTGKSDIREVKEVDFDEFKDKKLQKGLRNISINSYFNSFEHFWNFFGFDLKLQYLQGDKDRVLRIQKQLLTSREFVTLLEVIDDPAFKAGVSIPYESGVRAGRYAYREDEGFPREGLLGLNWGDVDFEKCSIDVRLKGGDAKTLPLGEFSEKYLRELKESGNRGKIRPNDPIFVTKAGKRMSYSRFTNKLKKYMESAGIPKEKRHLHALRHTCGTQTTKRYGVYTTKLLLCHKRLQTTEIYVHLSEDDLMQTLRPDKAKANGSNELDKPQMKKCPKCGKEFTPDRKLCVCGYDFTQNRCASCGVAVEKGSHFCPFCGASLSPPQPECICGQELKAEYKICPNCGRPTQEIMKLWNEKDFEKWSSPHSVKPNEYRDEKDWSLPNFNGAKKEKIRPNSDCNLSSHGPIEDDDGHCRFKIASNKEQLIELLEQNWELVKINSTGEFLLRKPDNERS